MNTITITFEHSQIEAPKYKFGDCPLSSAFGNRVAVAGDCSPKLWPTGKVVGLLLEDALIPQWFYAVQLDSPKGLVEEFPADDLVLESDILHMQAGWNVEEDSEEAVEECDRCDGSGYIIDDRTFESFSCSRVRRYWH